jgi:hypothetical protein
VEAPDENRQGSELSFAAAGDEASSFSFNDQPPKAKPFQTTAASGRTVPSKVENDDENEIL